MPFLYGNHVAKAHLGRITEDTPEHQGVVVFSMNDTPLVGISFLLASITTILYVGLRRDGKVDNRHKKIGSHIHYRLPSSVSKSYQSSCALPNPIDSDVGEYLRDEVCCCGCLPKSKRLTSYAGHTILILTTLFFLSYVLLECSALQTDCRRLEILKSKGFDSCLFHQELCHDQLQTSFSTKAYQECTYTEVGYLAGFRTGKTTSEPQMS